MSIEKIYTTNTYEVFAVTWSGIIDTIEELGIAQLLFFYRNAGDTTWIGINKSSFKATYSETSKSVDLTNATVTTDGVEVPINLDKTKHEIRILRDTSKLLYINFQEGSKISSKDLNSVNLQPIHLVEEEEITRSSADSAIYTHVAEELTGYYTKTEIDTFFRGLTLPNWAADKYYIVGDTVLHDDPNTAASTLLIWYCGVAHTSSTGNQPSASGTGASYWTNVAPNSSLDNLNYIRKLPGLASTPNDWNKITPQNANAIGLQLVPITGQSATLFGIRNAANTEDLLRFSLENDNLGLLHLDAANFKVDLDSYLSHESTGSTLFNTDSTTIISSPVSVFKGRDSQWTMQVINKDATSNFSSTANNVFTISGTTDKTQVWKDFKTTGDYTELAGPLIAIGHSSLKDCTGSNLMVTLGGGPAVNDIRVLRSVDIGTVDNCTSNTFTARITIDADNGHATVNGTVTAGEFKDATLANATYLSADSNGVIQKETGSVPSTSRIAYNVTGSNTALSDGDVVYLDSTTQVWTKSVRTDSTKLAVGVIDDKSGSNGNQSFNVIFSGVVDGYTSLTIGNWCWLSDTPGGITQTAPTAAGSIIDPVGIAVTATSIMVMPARPHQLPS